MRQAFGDGPVVGRRCYELLHGTDAPPEWCPTCEAFETGRPRRTEICEEHLGRKWFEVSAVPLKGADGKVTHLVHSFRNITDRKRAEEALDEAHAALERRVEERTAELQDVNRELRQEAEQRRRAEEELRESELFARTIISSVGEGVIVYDRELRYRVWNKFMEDLSGMPAEEVLGKPALELFPHLRGQGIDQLLARALSGETVASEDTPYHVPGTGKSGWVRGVYTPHVGVNGEILGVVGSVRDAAHRKKTEAALEQALANWQVTFDSVSDVILVFDEQFVVVKANQAASTLCGLPVEEIVGKRCCELFEATKLLPHEPLLAGLKESREHREEEVYLAEAEQWMLATVDPVLDDQGRTAGCLHVMKDITQRKRAEEELKQYAESQQELLKEVNHRVMNNLTAIIGILGKERGRVKAENGHGVMPILDDATARIESLATAHRMLAASRWRPLLLCDLCRELIRAAIQGMSPQKEVKLEIAPSRVQVDSEQAHHLALVINELATNASKHAPAGRQELRIRVEIGEDQGKVRVVFRDDGPGFPEEVLAGSSDRAGIGLDLVQGIVRRSLRGMIQLKNEGGAVVTITFGGAV